MTIAQQLRMQLPEIGDGLAAAFLTLHGSPTASACEELAIRLNGSARHVMKLREALLASAQSPPSTETPGGL